MLMFNEVVYKCTEKLFKHLEFAKSKLKTVNGYKYSIDSQSNITDITISKIFPIVSLICITETLDRLDIQD